MPPKQEFREGNIQMVRHSLKYGKIAVFQRIVKCRYISFDACRKWFHLANEWLRAFSGHAASVECSVLNKLDYGMEAPSAETTQPSVNGHLLKGATFNTHRIWRLTGL
jgi:hypothetical protein